MAKQTLSIEQKRVDLDSGFLDLSNIGRYFLFGFAAIFALIGIATGLKGWKK